MIHRLRNSTLCLAVALSLAGVASADVLHLKRGGKIEGILVGETPTDLTIDIGMGLVSLPRATVARVERRSGALSEYRSQRAALAPDDIKAWVHLARFAGEHGLNSEARATWIRVLNLDPANVEAHLALGHVLLNGRYVDEDEANRARGLIRFEGRWMTTAEVSALLTDRERRAADERRLEDARRNARDAEDRARRAEIELARERAAGASSRNLPVWGYGGPVLVGSPYFGGYTAGCRGAACNTVPQIWSPPAAPVVTPAPRVKPLRPSSIR